MAVNNGAEQFSAFAALTGFDEIIKEHERVTEMRREMAEDAAQELSEKMNGVQKGSKIKATFYCRYGYETAEGIVSDIDFIYRILKIGGKKISFDDIADIEISE